MASLSSSAPVLCYPGDDFIPLPSCSCLQEMPFTNGKIHVHILYLGVPAFLPPLTTWRLGYAVGPYSLWGNRLGNMLEVQFINVQSSFSRTM